MYNNGYPTYWYIIQKTAICLHMSSEIGDGWGSLLFENWGYDQKEVRLIHWWDKIQSIFIEIPPPNSVV